MSKPDQSSPADNSSSPHELSNFETSQGQIKQSLEVGVWAESFDEGEGGLANLVNSITKEQIEWISSWLAGEGFELTRTKTEKA